VLVQVGILAVHEAEDAEHDVVLDRIICSLELGMQLSDPHNGSAAHDRRRVDQTGQLVDQAAQRALRVGFALLVLREELERKAADHREMVLQILLLVLRLTQQLDDGHRALALALLLQEFSRQVASAHAKAATCVPAREPSGRRWKPD
jgi:hypothetical protein